MQFLWLRTRAFLHLQYAEKPKNFARAEALYACGRIYLTMQQRSKRHPRKAIMLVHHAGTLKRLALGELSPSQFSYPIAFNALSLKSDGAIKSHPFAL
jgi:hypothetical protein